MGCGTENVKVSVECHRPIVFHPHVVKEPKKATTADEFRLEDKLGPGEKT